ncbi:ABC transporter substrate-binding protein [Oerskovia paurometabola]|uniref:ABC transporter substrate-binding protein n=1 Tax=Oerskovia paurometabola TaxID=162170 RepID=UPI00343E538E
MTLVLPARTDVPDVTLLPVAEEQWQRIVAAITRRDFLIGAGALTVAGILAACGDEAGSAGAGSAGGETQPFEHDGYRTDLPLHPERVVVLEARAGLEFALLAGLPIVATEWSDESHLMAHLPKGVERLGGSNIEPNAESILSHSPDMLVVGAGWWNYYQENELLAEGIAPVLVVGDDDPDWKASLRRQLAAFGREQQATEAIDAYDATVADVSAEIGPLVAGRTVVIAGADEEGFWIQEPDSFCSGIARDVGMDLVVPEAGQSNGSVSRYSFENLDVFHDADLIVLQNPEDPATANPAWQAVPAVQAGRVAELRYDRNFGLALTAQVFAEDLREAARLL